MALPLKYIQAHTIPAVQTPTPAPWIEKSIDFNLTSTKMVKYRLQWNYGYWDWIRLFSSPSLSYARARMNNLSEFIGGQSVTWWPPTEHFNILKTTAQLSKQSWRRNLTSSRPDNNKRSLGEYLVLKCQFNTSSCLAN